MTGYKPSENAENSAINTDNYSKRGAQGVAMFIYEGHGVVYLQIW